MLGIDPSAGLVGELANGVGLGAIVLRRHERWEPARAELGGATQRGPGMPAEPDVRMRSLDRPGQQPKVLHVKIATSVGDFLLGPQASDQRDRFLGAAGRLRTV